MEFLFCVKNYLIVHMAFHNIPKWDKHAKVKKLYKAFCVSVLTFNPEDKVKNDGADSSRFYKIDQNRFWILNLQAKLRLSIKQY